jgi:hypothetical protein
MPTRSGRRYHPYGRSTRSNTPVLPTSRRPRTNTNRPCNDCPAPAPAPPNEPIGRSYGENDECKRHRKPDDEPKTKYVSGYRRR